MSAPIRAASNDTVRARVCLCVCVCVCVSFSSPPPPFSAPISFRKPSVSLLCLCLSVCLSVSLCPSPPPSLFSLPLPLSPPAGWATPRCSEGRTLSGAGCFGGFG